MSQTRFAEDLGEKRGKIAAYEETADARPEFYHKVAIKFGIDLHQFLTVKMTDENYDTFFKIADTTLSVASEPQPHYGVSSDLVGMIQMLKKPDGVTNREEIADRLISMMVKLIEENNNLRKEMLNMLKSRTQD